MRKEVSVAVRQLQSTYFVTRAATNDFVSLYIHQTIFHWQQIWIDSLACKISQSLSSRNKMSFYANCHNLWIFSLASYKTKEGGTWVWELESVDFWYFVLNYHSMINHPSIRDSSVDWLWVIDSFVSLFSALHVTSPLLIHCSQQQEVVTDIFWSCRFVPHHVCSVAELSSHWRSHFKSPVGRLLQLMNFIWLQTCNTVSVMSCFVVKWSIWLVSFHRCRAGHVCVQKSDSAVQPQVKHSKWIWMLCSSCCCCAPDALYKCTWTSRDESDT